MESELSPLNRVHLLIGAIAYAVAFGFYWGYRAASAGGADRFWPAFELALVATFAVGAFVAASAMTWDAMRKLPLQPIAAFNYAVIMLVSMIASASLGGDVFGR